MKEFKDLGFEEDLSDLGFQAEDATPEQQTPGMIEATLRGAAQGLTFSGADELTAALESALSDKTYQQALEESRGAYKAAEEAHPYISTAGNIAGGIGGATAAALAAPALGLGGVVGAGAQGLSTLQKLGKLASAGAGYGALSGLGASEKSLTEQPVELAKDVAKSAAEGAILTPVVAGGVSALGKVGKTISKPVADYLQKYEPVQDLQRSWNIGRPGFATPEGVNITRSVDPLEQELTTKSKQAQTFINDKLSLIGGAKRQLLEEADLLGKTKPAIQLIDDAEKSINSVSNLQDRGVLQDILNQIKNEAADPVNKLDLRNLPPSKFESFGERFKDYTPAGTSPNKLDTSEAKRLVMSLAKKFKDEGISAVDGDVTESLLKKLPPEKSQELERYLSSIPDGFEKPINALNTGYSELAQSADILGMNRGPFGEVQFNDLNKLAEGFSRSASDTSAGIRQRRTLDKVKDLIKTVAPEATEKAFTPAEEAGANLYAARMAKGQVGAAGALKTIAGLASSATGTGANLGARAYNKVEAMANPVKKTANIMAQYASKVHGPDALITKSLQKVANATDANRRTSMMNTLMQNPYTRNLISDLEKTIGDYISPDKAEDNLDGTETK